MVVKKLLLSWFEAWGTSFNCKIDCGSPFYQLCSDREEINLILSVKKNYRKIKTQAACRLVFSSAQTAYEDHSIEFRSVEAWRVMYTEF